MYELSSWPVVLRKFKNNLKDSMDQKNMYDHWSWPVWPELKNNLKIELYVSKTYIFVNVTIDRGELILTILQTEISFLIPEFVLENLKGNLRMLCVQVG